MKNLLLSLILLLPFAMAPTTHTQADDSPSDSKPNPADIQAQMDKARTLIEASKFKRAISELNPVVRSDKKNADAWNLIGYSNRKLGKYKKAGKAYRKALKYNPEHKGALEYQGELFIKLKTYDKARANRDRLAALCPDGCEELTDLDQALAAIK